MGKRKREEEVPGCVWAGPRERNWASVLGKKKERREREMGLGSGNGPQPGTLAGIEAPFLFFYLDPMLVLNPFPFCSNFLSLFFKQKTAYEIGVRLVGSEMCIRDRGGEEKEGGGGAWVCVGQTERKELGLSLSLIHI